MAMWQISVLAAAVAAVKRSGAEATPLDYYHFGDLKVLTDMFVDCDTFIVSDGGILQNVHQVVQPLRLYSNWEEYKKGTKIAIYDFYSENYVRMALILRKELKGRNCKAQILVFYRPVVLDTANTLHELSGFRPMESTYRYSVIIHKANYEIKTAMYFWRLRTVQIIIPHFYHVTMACQDEHGPTDRYTGEGSLIGRQYSGWTKCYLSSFKTACLHCKMNNVLEHPCTLYDQKECPRAIAEDSQHDGSITSNERQLAVAHLHAYISVYGMRLQLGNPPPVLHTNRWINYREFLKTFQQKFGRHAILTKKDELIFPEEIFLDSVFTHHGNMTVRLHTDKSHPFKAHELIYGPGSPPSTFLVEVDSAQVGTVGYSFMTCSNISFAARTGIFSAPFDGPTWICTLAIVVAVSVALLMAMKKMSAGAALFLLVYTMVRLLLENHSDVTQDLVRRRKLMAFLVLLMALATIILSNGYKGVLTSDFSMTPIPATGTTFEQVLASNWSLNWHASSMFNKQQMQILVQSLVNIRMILSLELWAGASARLLPSYAILTDAGEKEYRLALMVDAKLKEESKVWNEWEDEDFVKKLDKFCSCNGSYWLIEKGTFVHPEMPRGCDRLSADEIFFVSEESIGNRSISWSTISLRPGPVFTSIRRSVEGGLYHWLRKIRSNWNEIGVCIENNFLMRIPKNDPKPLTMETMLVSSTFRLHGVLSLLTIAVLVCECLWKHKKRLYFALRRWIAIAGRTCSRFRKVTGK